MLSLAAAGASRFLVPNSPDIGLVPAVTAAGPQAAFLATTLSAKFNSALALALGALGAIPGIDITGMDVFGLMNAMVADPAAAGFSNVTDACVTPGVTSGAFCKRPGDYLFWDGIHPTRSGHHLFAVEALRVLGVE